MTDTPNVQPLTTTAASIQKPPLNYKTNYPFLLVFPWSDSTFRVVGEVGSAECNHDEVKRILAKWSEKHL